MFISLYTKNYFYKAGSQIGLSIDVGAVANFLTVLKSGTAVTAITASLV